MTTVNEKYGDGSSCIVCDKCGLCITHGDCKFDGCGEGVAGPQQSEGPVERVVIPEKIKYHMKRCPDYPDFPTAWAIQEDRGESLKHDKRCSCVPGWDKISGSHFLCDCGAVVKEWERLREYLEV